MSPSPDRDLRPHLIWAALVLALSLLGTYVLLVLTGHSQDARDFGGGVLAAGGVGLFALYIWGMML
jgi:hypothetical protein